MNFSAAFDYSEGFFCRKEDSTWTKTLTGTCNPAWNESFQFNISDAEQSILEISILCVHVLLLLIMQSPNPRPIPHMIFNQSMKT